MPEPIHILLIDDSAADSAYIESFQTRARDFGMKVTHLERGKNGLAELEANPFKYKAVILDARCIWDDTGVIPNDKFVFQMVGELERLEKELRLFFPAVVNTAYIEDFAEEREFMRNRGGDIFHKSSGTIEDETKIFDFIKERIQNLDEWKHRDVFWLFDQGEFDRSVRMDLRRILKRQTELSGEKDSFNPVRSMLEAIFRKIKETDPALLPDEIFIHRLNQGINLEWSWKYLSGFPIREFGNGKLVVPTAPAFVPRHISACMKFVKETSTRISHEYDEEVSIYTYNGVVFALLEILLWLRCFLEQRKRK
jgi:hypothetical protein